MQFSSEDLVVLTLIVADAWQSGADRDWSVNAGTLTWSCFATADHAVDTVLAPAFFLASRNTKDYPAFEPFTLGPSPTPDQLIEGLHTATTILTAVVSTAPADARALIWYRPIPEVRGPADFVPRAALELIIHAHDVCAGLAVAFDPPRDLCERLRQHTKDWPLWNAPGFSPLSMSSDPWTDLLKSAGRTF